MKEPKREAPVASAILLLLAGPLLWAGHLMLVYGMQSAICAIGSDRVTLVVLPSIILATLAAVALLVLILLFPGSISRVPGQAAADHHMQSFSIRVARLLSLLSLVGVIWSGAAVSLLDACGSLR